MLYVLWLLIAGLIASSVASAVFSFKSRRSADRRERGLYSAKTNIAMGLMLMLIAVIQLFMYTASTVQVIIGAMFGLLGLFNLFAGLRNRAMYANMDRETPSGK